MPTDRRWAFSFSSGEEKPTMPAHPVVSSPIPVSLFSAQCSKSHSRTYCPQSPQNKGEPRFYFFALYVSQLTKSGRKVVQPQHQALGGATRLQKLRKIDLEHLVPVSLQPRIKFRADVVQQDGAPHIDRIARKPHRVSLRHGN